MREHSRSSFACTTRKALMFTAHPQRCVEQLILAFRSCLVRRNCGLQESCALVAIRVYQLYTFPYSRKLVSSDSPLRRNVGRRTCRTNRSRRASLDTTKNRKRVGLVSKTSLNLSRPEYTGVECSTSNNPSIWFLPAATQMTSI